MKKTCVYLASGSVVELEISKKEEAGVSNRNRGGRKRV